MPLLTNASSYASPPSTPRNGNPRLDPAMSPHPADSSTPRPQISALAIAFWLLVCAAAAVISYLSTFHGSGGDPAGNGMSSGLIELFSIAAGVLVGLLALIFLACRNLAVRGVLTALLGLFTLLLLALAGH
ncbi:hypothetical protein FV242_22980 [Methylobacterium sp. WL64]|uniref:hypothetical protein n=1 Tax=Methylobacterium sp. WL64 TaxID=2603894 RepID=UPI0011CC0B6D|nr:hypothetical protein [Methylobacterium sp. WL64]TXN00161.1 hypothetical protein FV242_22980 [Methylobacterium sp. WL64]